MSVKVAIQGVRGCFHEEAAYKYFGDNIETVECESFKKTCELLKRGEVDYVAMAIENSIAGGLLPNHSLLRDYRFPIVGEVYLHIKLHLLVTPNTTIQDIKYVESHPIALQQCSDYLEENPQFNIIEGEDTAGSAKKVSELQLKDTAAIANQLSAKLYGLDILERRIETNKKNYTRFLILAKEAAERPHVNKASLSFQTGNGVGSLSNVLQCFAEQNINLSRIQSMPVLGKRNEYDFYVDVEWQNQADYEAAIRHVLKHTNNFNIMGEYVKNDKV
ncbi:prephenate dehydratase [Parapedobacter sp. 2B3]|uniref:prephenate dehydratase n=1 Tax=Parapedobacter sp. 2B3 TaxID=3342381 RepID=UPI0035B683D1